MSTRRMGQRAATAGRLTIVSLALLLHTPTATHADLAPYGQSFEGMVVSDPGALSGDGWLVYGNVFHPDMTYFYGYGPFPAPNSGPPAFCRLVTGEGSASQGNVQLSVYSDYENAGHASGDLIESNVYQERTIGAADVGNRWFFVFDAKRGNLAGNTTALAFIKTLAPPTYALTNYVTVDMTSIPATWDRYAISLTISAGLVGQIFQFGFSNLATNYEASAVFYDNLELTTTIPTDAPSATARRGLALRAIGNPVAERMGQSLAFTSPRDGRVTVRVYDMAGRRIATLWDGEMAAGPQQVTWHGVDDAGQASAPGVYFAEVVAGAERAIVKLARVR